MAACTRLPMNPLHGLISSDSDDSESILKPTPSPVFKKKKLPKAKKKTVCRPDLYSSDSSIDDFVSDPVSKKRKHVIKSKKGKEISDKLGKVKSRGKNSAGASGSKSSKKVKVDKKDKTPVQQTHPARTESETILIPDDENSRDSIISLSSDNARPPNNFPHSLRFNHWRTSSEMAMEVADGAAIGGTDTAESDQIINDEVFSSPDMSESAFDRLVEGCVGNTLDDVFRGSPEGCSESEHVSSPPTSSFSDFKSPIWNELSRPPRTSVNRSAPSTTSTPFSFATPSTSGGATANDSMTISVNLVKQMEKDEEMARKLQEDMDKEYAIMIAQNASTPSRPSAPAPHMDSQNEIISRIERMLPAEWALYTNLVQTFPEPNHLGDFGGSIDMGILSFLRWNPEYIRNRNEFIARERRPIATRQASRGRRFSTDELDSSVEGMILDGMNQLEPTVLRGRGRPRGRPVRRPSRPRARMQPHHLPQWLLQDSFNNENDYEALLALEEQLGGPVKKGLTDGQINCLPVKKFSSESQSSAAEKECLVCMSEYENGDKLRFLPCFHNFHDTCIVKWIKEHPTCPVCRHKIEV